MFDIGFWEICLIALVALVVIGPERLPKAARVAGLWWGKMNRMVTSVKQEIREELRAEEMRQELQQQAKALDEVKGAMQDTRDAIRDLDEPPQTVASDDRLPEENSNTLQPETPQVDAKHDNPGK